jgi:hypothetical protein
MPATSAGMTTERPVQEPGITPRLCSPPQDIKRIGPGKGFSEPILAAPCPELFEPREENTLA